MNKYEVNYTKEDIISYHVREWVMNWVKKYHPEVFKEAEKFVLEKMKSEN
jgi:hypothetical protein